jgi:hypothetical protein
MNGMNISSCDAAEQSAPSQKAFEVLFGRTAGHGRIYQSPRMPSNDEEWNVYCHAPNWPDITKVDPVKWWEVST